MVRIRLRRIGAKKKPSYRIVIADKRSPRDGRFIETVGFYNPRTEPETVEIKNERVVHWLNHGAQPSEAVARLLRRNGIIDEQGKVNGQGETDAAGEESAETAEENSPEADAESSEVDAEAETAVA